MKFSESWLRSLVNPALDSAALSHLLTMAGLEVEEEQAVAPAFSGVVVAEVLSVEKHANADRLNVCQVNVGGEQPLQIVCGAPNVAAGLKVPCALVGAELPNDFRIKQAKVRGIESSGMLCSATELGLAEVADGLLLLPADAPVGQLLRDYLDLDDTLFTLKLTPNRADCLSLQGIARDVAALTGDTLKRVPLVEVPVTSTATQAVKVSAPVACPRYLGRVMTGVNARAATPEWLRRRLERSGLRSISAVVDITNYVLLELGQPLHAFDADALKGEIDVRFARAGESLALLNDKTVSLSEDLLVIADASGPVALAGIMGGSATAVGDATQTLFLEAAFFNPNVIVGKGRVLGFASDSSHRFERGVDFSATRDALERASQLVLDLCGGAAGPVVEVVGDLPARPPVHLRVARANRILGLNLPQAQMVSLLQRLGCLVDEANDVLHVTPPSYRFDLQIEEDLVEELVRVVGYDHVPETLPARATGMLPVWEQQRPRNAIAELLAHHDYQEVINYAFVDATWERILADNVRPIALLNPIASQMSVMRSTLFGGLLQNLSDNLRRKQTRVRIFEMGRCFLRAESGFSQPERLAGLAFGPRLPEQWGIAEQRVDFYDVKADVEALFVGFKLSFAKTAHPALHPGRSARVLVDGVDCGVIGELHPRWVQHFDLPAAAQMFELDLAQVLRGRQIKAESISRLPAVRRDIAVLIDEGIEAQSVLDTLAEKSSERVRSVKLFDVYRGKGVAEGQKSLAFAVTLQDTHKTLTDDEIGVEITKLINVLVDVYHATLRN